MVLALESRSQAGYFILSTEKHTKTLAEHQRFKTAALEDLESFSDLKLEGAGRDQKSVAELYYRCRDASGSSDVALLHDDLLNHPVQPPLGPPVFSCFDPSVVTSQSGLLALVRWTAPGSRASGKIVEARQGTRIYCPRVHLNTYATTRPGRTIKNMPFKPRFSCPLPIQLPRNRERHAVLNCHLRARTTHPVLRLRSVLGAPRRPTSLQLQARPTPHSPFTRGPAQGPDVPSPSFQTQTRRPYSAAEQAHHSTPVPLPLARRNRFPSIACHARLPSRCCALAHPRYHAKRLASNIVSLIAAQASISSRPCSYTYASTNRNVVETYIKARTRYFDSVCHPTLSTTARFGSPARLCIDRPRVVGPARRLSKR
ncbi:hypothetical protein B0H16DRAFT_1475129 [Mycena metata]|uniref:Uncharacterized protein n=1 Tax=Mycena metata TaxID=1033252 RepID=A0AAD7MJ48_9AGAR|nr:hypothetical protein B0H16DRAFT_1475129 [Mycena metata]